MVILEILKEIWIIFMEMAPYLFLGLTFAGILHIFFKKDTIYRHLGKHNLSSVIKAAVLGVPLPLCSCGVVPTAISLKNNKASESAVLSFLISTPQTGIDSIIATYGMMGPVYAIFRPLAAFIMGIAGGLVTTLFVKDSETGQAEECADGCCAIENKEEPKTFVDKIKSMISYAYVEFLDDIAKWLFVGIIISGIIAYIVPDNFFATVGAGIGGMLLMLVAGIPLYICATASIPIAMILIAKGISPGAAFVFLAAGPATNAATITLITNVMGRRITAIYIGAISVLSIVFGYLLNFTFDTLGISAQKQAAAMHHHSGMAWWQQAISIVFLVLLILSFYRKFFRKKATIIEEGENVMAGVRFKVEGMTCNHCVANVKKAVEKVEGVESVEVNLEEKYAEFTGSADPQMVRKAIEDVGYTVLEG